MAVVMILGSLNVDLVTRVERHPAPGETVLGTDFVRLFSTVKRFELARFRGSVTDWERNEYLEIY